ncbi:hypothetical protein GNP61_05350 [Aliivibrio fischeri]|nr:hypothetical protein [Aliivibrio fischeri]MUK40982.1 hypothetical protein [Aliivibrio fischeri]
MVDLIREAERFIIHANAEKTNEDTEEVTKYLLSLMSALKSGKLEYAYSK